jgi:hypothetical protein
MIVLKICRVSESAPPGIQRILSYASGWLAALGTRCSISPRQARANLPTLT